MIDLKKVIIALFAITCILTLISPVRSIRSGWDTGSMVSYWTLDDANISGSMYLDDAPNHLWDITINGVTTGESCVVGECAYFDGANNRLNLTYLAQDVFSSNGYVAFWMNGSAGIPISKGNCVGYYWVIMKNGTERVEMQVTGYITAPVQDIESNSNVYNQGWHHVVFNKQSTQMQVWVDGVLDANESTEAVWDESTSTIFYMGGCTATGGDYTGWIDEVILGNDSLTKDQIGILYNNGTGCNPLTSCGIDVPEKPVIITPSNGTQVWGNTNIDWDAVTDPNGDPVTYSVYLYNTSDIKVLDIITGTSDTNATWDTTSPVNFDDGTYYLILNVTDGVNVNTSDSVYVIVNTSLSIMQSAPSAPAITTPTNNSIIAGDVTINWSVSVDPENDSIVYDVILYYSNDTIAAYISSGITGLGAVLSTYEQWGDAAYYLIVNVSDGNYSVSSNATYVTIDNQYPMSKPVITSPSNASTVMDNVTINWTAAVDPDSDPINYRADIYFANGSHALVVYNPTTDLNATWFTNIYPFNESAGNGLYYIIVNATDGNYTNSSDAVYAYVNNTLPNRAPNITIVSPLNGSTYYRNEDVLFSIIVNDPDNDNVTCVAIIQPGNYSVLASWYSPGVPGYDYRQENETLSFSGTGRYSWYILCTDGTEIVYLPLRYQYFDIESRPIATALQSCSDSVYNAELKFVVIMTMILLLTLPYANKHELLSTVLSVYLVMIALSFILMAIVGC